VGKEKVLEGTTNSEGRTEAFSKEYNPSSPPPGGGKKITINASVGQKRV